MAIGLEYISRLDLIPANEPETEDAVANPMPITSSMSKPGASADGLFEAIDTNGDGVITRSEFSNIVTITA